jgi:[ribosomal protein S5]-alanine N-acetyltransferase
MSSGPVRQEVLTVMADFDFSAFPTLAGARTVLRQLDPSDAVDLFAFRSDPEVQRYNSAPMQDPAEATALIDELRAQYAAQQAVHWAVTLPGDPRVLGLMGLAAVDNYHSRAEIGYDLRRDHWGRGVATDAARAILTFGFISLDLHRVEAQTIADNHASVRLLQRLGFQLEGVRRDHSWEEDGSFHDSAVYGLLRHEFS